METLLKLAKEYSTPVLLLICLGAALIFTLKLVMEQTIKKEFNRQTKELELRLQRRLAFEEYILLERYKLVNEFSQGLNRITTDLNRYFSGQKVDELFVNHELVPLTKIFEDLESKRFQLSELFYHYFYDQAQLVLQIANTKAIEKRQQLINQYRRNYEELVKLVNTEFGTDKISW